MLPTFLVYTMHCGEPDWPHCQAMLAAQKNVIVKHQVVSNLPEVDAHNVVYQAFNAAKPTWIRAKIDADVVLSDPHTLERIAVMLAQLPSAAGISPKVHDFLTDCEIHAGMAFYTSRVTFNTQQDALYCDRNVIVNPYNHYIHSTGVMGRHMHHCGELTAFRYGFHRGLKKQTSIFNSVKDAYARLGDVRRRRAIQGFEVAMAGDYGSVGHNYGDAAFVALFEQSRECTTD